jgi:hypothetical protein
MDYLKFLEQKRDEIIASYGVPPAKVGIIESGNLGGGTGEAQDRTFMINTCQPIAELILEALNFALAKNGFGVSGWRLKFRDIDMRDSKTVEDIRDIRLKNGSWTLNRYRVDIGEPAVDGGDQPVLVDRENLVKWADMDAASKASIANKLKGTALEPADPQHGEPVTVEKPEPAPVPPQLKAFAGAAPPGPRATTPQTMPCRTSRRSQPARHTSAAYARRWPPCREASMSEQPPDPPPQPIQPPDPLRASPLRAKDATASDQEAASADREGVSGGVSRG